MGLFKTHFFFIICHLNKGKDISRLRSAYSYYIHNILHNTGCKTMY